MPIHCSSIPFSLVPLVLGTVEKTKDLSDELYASAQGAARSHALSLTLWVRQLPTSKATLQHAAD